MIYPIFLLHFAIPIITTNHLNQCFLDEFCMTNLIDFYYYSNTEIEGNLIDKTSTWLKLNHPMIIFKNFKITDNSPFSKLIHESVFITLFSHLESFQLSVG